MTLEKEFLLFLHCKTSGFRQSNLPLTSLTISRVGLANLSDFVLQPACQQGRCSSHENFCVPKARVPRRPPSSAPPRLPPPASAEPEEAELACPGSGAERLRRGRCGWSGRPRLGRRGLGGWQGAAVARRERRHGLGAPGVRRALHACGPSAAPASLRHEERRADPAGGRT